MTALDTIKSIQTALGVTADGLFGPNSLFKLHALINAAPDSAWPPAPPVVATGHTAQASSFGDPADVAAYEKAIADGKTEQQALALGDNGVGWRGDNTKEGTGPSCALSPETMIATWGSESAAHLKPVLITGNGRSVTALVKDTLPHNSTRIDLNPDSVRALGWEPPLLETVQWQPA